MGIILNGTWLNKININCVQHVPTSYYECLMMGTDLILTCQLCSHQSGKTVIQSF